MKDYQIKPVTTDDVAALVDVSRETFAKTFSDTTADDDMAEYLDQAFAPEQLIQEIKDPGSRFLFLMVDSQVAGYLKVNVEAAQTESLKPNAFEIQRIYLRKSYQHQGLGNALINYAGQLARQEGKDYIWLGVYEYNINAQHFYAHHGFHRVGHHTFQVGTDTQTDYLILKKI